jgi:hypothetical protein
MPLIFSYGSLQQDDVQLSTFGRRLDGQTDELVGFESTLVPIDDPAVAARLGKTHHAGIRFTGNEASRVPGIAFEITEGELVGVDEYESAFSYTRIPAALASGRPAWVYVHTPAPTSEA